MYDKFGQYINGKWQKSSNEETYAVLNPATEETLGMASKASSKDINDALLSAKKGLEIWKKTTPWERAKIIRRIAVLIRKRKEVLAKWITLEVGKPISEALGEVGGAADIFEWNSEETKRIYGEIVESRFENTKMFVKYEPVGVVAAFGSLEFSCYFSIKKNFDSIRCRMFCNM